MEGVYQLTKYMAFDEDNAIIDEMKGRYYKMYFQTVKQEKNEQKTQDIHPDKQ